VKLLIQDSLLVTLNPGDEVLQGDLLIQDGAIALVGSRVDAAREQPDRVIDGRQFIAMPGLVSAHGHFAEYLFKGRHYDRPLEIWRQYGRAARRTLKGPHLYAGTSLACLEMLKSGTTTALDHHYTGMLEKHMGVDHVFRAMRDTGIRGVVAQTIADRAYEQTVPLDTSAMSEDARREAERISAFENRETLDDCIELIETYRDFSPRLKPMIGPSAPQRCTKELLLRSLELAHQYDVGLHMHVLETKTQAIQCQRLFGKSPFAYLADIGFLSPRLSTPHSVWAKYSDLPLIAKHQVTPIHNPASNLFLGSGLAMVPRMHREGITVALGTDGASSNDTQNIFDAMRLAALIHNVTEQDYEHWLTPRQVLRMGTLNGARACLLQDQIGSLEPGKRADVVLLRRNALAYTPLNDVYGQIAYCENGSNVDTVLVDGEVVVEGGRSTLVDEDALMREAEALRRELDPDVDEETRRTRALEPNLRKMYLEAVSEPWSREA
jgi:5-methylthioadenosine/S-adenosylhomocysteine deaminase